MHPDPRIYDHPSVWRGPDMSRRDDWIVRLDEDDVREVEGALARVKARGMGVPRVTKEDFDIPRVARKLDGVRDALENGHGFALYSFGADGKRGGEGDARDLGVLPAS